MLEDGQEPNAPIYYVVNRKSEPDAVAVALVLTPIDCAIVGSVLDYDYASQLCGSVILTEDVEEMRKRLDRPVILVGEADFVDAVYADGRRESLRT